MAMDENEKRNLLDEIDDEIAKSRGKGNDKIKFLLEAQSISKLKSVVDDYTSHLANPPLDGAGDPLTEVGKVYGPDEANILAWVATGVALLLIDGVNSLGAIRGEVTSRLLFEDMDGLGGDDGFNFLQLAIVSGGIQNGDILGMGNSGKSLLVSGFTGTFTVK